jgi:hypothetical protein
MTETPDYITDYLNARTETRAPYPLVKYAEDGALVHVGTGAVLFPASLAEAAELARDYSIGLISEDAFMDALQKIDVTPTTAFRLHEAHEAERREELLDEFAWAGAV